MLDGDRLNGTQVASGCKFERYEINNECFFYVHHVDQKSQLSYIVVYFNVPNNQSFNNLYPKSNVQYVSGDAPTSMQ